MRPRYNFVRKDGVTPSRGTSRDFRHGPDVPITRKSVELLLAGEPGLSPERIVRRFVTLPAYRHLRRVVECMPHATLQTV